MAKHIRGAAVPNATSYELFEKISGNYSSLRTASSLDFNLDSLNLASGAHTFAVKAKAEGYIDSEYSNELVYTITSGETPVDFTLKTGFWTTAAHNSGFGTYEENAAIRTTSVFAVKKGQTVIVNSCINKNICGLVETDATGETLVGTEPLITGGDAYETTVREYTATKDMYCVACSRIGSNYMNVEDFTIVLRG